jgi:DNA-binding NarL/FixJ family response regulator
MTQLIRVAFIDDHLLLLETLAARIGSEPDFEVVGTAVDADAGLELVCTQRPDIAVYDVALPGRGTFDTISEIQDKAKETKTVFLTGYLSDVFIEHALAIGAYGYLMKGEPTGNLIDALRRIANGEQCLSRAVEERLVYDPVRQRYSVGRATGLAELTNRQLEVLRHLARGRSVKQVAKCMHLSEKSIDSHKYRIMHKLGIHDRVELACYAIREGLLLP